MTELSTYNTELHRAWVIWHHAGELMLKCEDATFIESTGLSYQQFVILLTMALHDKPVTATYIAHHMGRNVNTLSTMLDRMESKKLVKKVRDLVDRRSVSLIMTDEGKRKLKEATKVGWELITRLLSDFSEEEIQLFMRLLEKLRKNIFKELTLKEAPKKLVFEETPEATEIKYFKKIMQLLSDPKY